MMLAWHLFQSPLHRGMLFNTSCSTRAARHRSYFSPLFIGECSSTICAAWWVLAMSLISVPSSSGNALQRSRHCKPRWMTTNFSPLFIGECSSTTQPLPRRMTNETEFQSPLHRGMLFNTARPLVQRRSKSFQSPLHRGMLFNDVLPASGPHLRCHFSPLFIGECSSTNRYQLVEVFACWHFSPLFIGECSSTRSAHFASMKLKNFSPLFIGECSSTRLAGVI